MNSKFSVASGALLTGLAVIALAVPNTAYAADAGSSADSNTTLNVTAGTLDLAGTTDGDFGETSVSTIHNSGFTSSISEAPVVTDYRGGDGAWVLSVKSNGTFASQLGATLSVRDNGSAADSSASGATLTKPSATTITTADSAVTTASAANGKNDLKYSVGLNIAQGTNVKAQSYTDTLTWTLGTAVEQGEGSN